MSQAAAIQTPAKNGRLWGLAALLALALHAAGIVAALVTLRGEIDDDAMGAPAIEISMEPAAPRIADAPDLPPGPLMDESAAAAPSVASSEAREANEPKIAQAQAEDAEFTRNEKPDRPVEDSHAPEAKPVVSKEAAASEATAPPRSDAPKQADKPVAPAAGTDLAARKAILTWQKQLMAHLNHAKRYPSGAKGSAEVRVSFLLDRRGRVVSYSVKRSSGQPAFDEAALAMMKRADPVPTPPPVMADEGLAFEVPVLFGADRK